MKRIISIVLSLSLILSLLLPSITAIANASPEIYFESVTVQPGEDATVSVRINNNSGFSAFAIEMNYDAEALTPVSSTKGEVLSDTDGMFTKPNISGANGKLVASYAGIESVSGDGILFTVTFSVSDTALGEYEITLQNKDGKENNFIDENNQPIAVNYSTSSIYVETEVSDIKAIKFELAENAFLYDTQGYESENEYYYEEEDIYSLFTRYGNKLTITNKDNEEIEYIYDNGAYWNDTYGEIDYWELQITSVLPTTKTADSCSAYVSYKGCETEFTVKIKENPIDTIVYTPSNSVYTAGVEAYSDEDGYSIDEFFRDGDVLTFTLKDNTQKVFTYDSEEGWTDSYGDFPSDFFGKGNIKRNSYHLEIGENNVQFSYYGIEFPVTITINENNVKSISYVPNGDKYYYSVFADNDNEGGSYRFFRTGDKLIVTNKDNSTNEYIYQCTGEYNYVFADAQGNDIKEFIEYVPDFDNGRVDISFGEQNTSLPMTLIDKSVIDHIEFTPDTVSANADSKDDFYYNVGYPKNAEFKICYKDGTSKVYVFDDIDGDIGKDGEFMMNARDGGSFTFDYWNAQSDIPWTAPGEYEILFRFGIFTAPIKVILTNESQHQHSFTSVITQPTCTTKGYTTYTCSCGYSYVDNYVDAKGHTPKAAVKENVKAASYTAAGSYDSVVYCSVCGAEISRKKVTIPKLAKKANTLTVKAKKPTVKYAKLKKKNQTITLKKAMTVSKAQGKVTYQLSSAKKGKKNFKKYFKVAKNGKITVKKGLKKGTYTVKIKVSAAGNTEYNAAVKTVTVTIKVK